MPESLLFALCAKVLATLLPVAKLLERNGDQRRLLLKSQMLKLLPIVLRMLETLNQVKLQLMVCTLKFLLLSL